MFLLFLVLFSLFVVFYIRRNKTSIKKQMYENSWKNNKNKYQFDITSSFSPSKIYINMFNDDNRRQTDPKYINEKVRLYNML
jgi:hypothetical protein